MILRCFSDCVSSCECDEEDGVLATPLIAYSDMVLRDPRDARCSLIRSCSRVEVGFTSDDVPESEFPTGLKIISILCHLMSESHNIRYSRGGGVAGCPFIADWFLASLEISVEQSIPRFTDMGLDKKPIPVLIGGTFTPLLLLTLEREDDEPSEPPGESTSQSYHAVPLTDAELGTHGKDESWGRPAGWATQRLNNRTRIARANWSTAPWQSHAFDCLCS